MPTTMRSPVRRAWANLLLTTLALCVAGSARAAAEERWYVVTMQGSRVGWMVERATERDGHLHSDMEMRLSIGRGMASVNLRFTSEFIETLDHEPVEMKSVQEFGTAPLATRHRFNPDGTVTVERTQAGRTTASTEDAPAAAWLTPGEASKKFAAHIEAEDPAFELTVIDPMTGLVPVTASYTVVGSSNVEAMGKIVPATECRVTQSVMPGVTGTEFVDRLGGVVRADTDLGGIKMTVLLSEKELAMLPAEPVEMMASTFVIPDERIENARGVTEASYVLRLREGEMPDLPEFGAQRVERLDASSVRVVVNLHERADAPAEDAADEAYREASTYIDAEDPAIVELTRRALAGHSGDALSKAEALRAFVYEHVEEKSLGVGFATASEVCRTGQGDCSEHAVLLAAMLRAAEIPSRVASGLIYADAFAGHERIFGYHAWAQALVEVDGALRWVDVDGTLRSDGPSSDATHITLSVSSMGEGEVVNSMAALVPVLGRLSIEVERAQ